MNSGGLKSKPIPAKAYFAELLDGLGDTPKLLWCFFATLPDDCDVRFKKYVELFESYMPDGVHPIHENAKIKTFEEQIKQSDAVYIHGGSIAPLHDILGKYDISELFGGKSVGTNSASSMVLAEYAWSCDEREPMDGLGHFPFKFLAHFKSDYGSDDKRGPIDWEIAQRELQEYGDSSLPMHALEEGKFLVIEK